MRIYTAPELPLINKNDKSVFLAGSIEMGKAEEWQQKFLGKVSDFPNNWVFLNPRRKDWDSSWEQPITNPNFFQQVDWELTLLEKADYKIFYFADNTISPVTLMELGHYGGYNSYVICGKNYLRRGNVEIFCYRNNISMYETIDYVIEELKKQI
jgi:hypothetical protein